MSKITKYFANQAEYDAYWQGEQPGSKYLCIIQDSGVEGLENVLVTTSNNAPDSGGQQQEMGGSTIDIISEQAETIAEQLEEIEYQQEVIADYENDDTVSKKEYNTLVDEIDEATDITYDISGEEKPLEDGWYAVDEEGNYIQFEMIKETVGHLTVGVSDNFSYYFTLVDNGSQTTYYPIDDYDWLDINDPINLSTDGNKYGENKIYKEDSQAGELVIDLDKDTWQIQSAQQ